MSQKKTCEQYECSLDKESLKKAIKELNEDPKNRDSAVASFRQWIEQNSSWLKTPTDTNFLLAFLRNAKFAQLPARQRLVNYWTQRTKNKDWFADVDTTDKRLVEILDLGNYMPLKKRDKDGRAIILGKPAAIDVHKFKVDEVMKSNMIALDYLLMDENVQVNGFVLLLDMSDMKLSHQTFFSPDVMRRGMKVWIKSYPARYKSVHYYNTNPVFEAIFAIISPLMPDKLKRRLHFHGQNLFEIYDYIDKSVLPQEYLPDDYKGESLGSLQDCIDWQRNVVQSPKVREHILRLSSNEYGVNEALKPPDDEIFNASFRKLNID